MSITNWYQEPLALGALSVGLIALLLIVACSACWLCKSRQRYVEKLDRRNSIRASIRSNRSLAASAGSFDELGFKRRLERNTLAAPVKLMSVDSIDKLPPSSSVDESYDTTPPGRTPEDFPVDFSSPANDPYAHDPRLENAHANGLVRPTFDLTFTNRGFLERSSTTPDVGGSRDWSSTTGSTLDMKRSIDAEEHSLGNNSTLPYQHRTFGKQPLETAM
ncbi:hypothetical protein LAZ67_19000488 [Cordylochernes scorpioides]|uniref:Uncharacterized protein n=1 Tax=Cordylochernes scorpioides TaxID=51811 RepID=A0ABY6LH66_9ARAC|nr:hypothetical protein LAZ67_19000488 [Cordylochernes scorpioides]